MDAKCIKPILSQLFDRCMYARMQARRKKRQSLAQIIEIIQIKENGYYYSVQLEVDELACMHACCCMHTRMRTRCVIDLCQDESQVVIY